MIGKLLVIDGTDGSGKGTQTKILVERLKNEGYRVETISFPQYGQKSAGPIENYLNGQYGSSDEVGPYRASIFYAIDRYDASFKMKKWITEGAIVVCDRYVTANMGHQGSKIKNEKELSEYLEWLHHLEYHIFDIPKPDLNVILHVTPETSQRLVDQKAQREYIGDKKRDILEADLTHLRDAEKTYMTIAKRHPEFFKVIECEEGEILKSPEEISEILWSTIQPLLKS